MHDLLAMAYHVQLLELDHQTWPRRLPILKQEQQQLPMAKDICRFVLALLETTKQNILSPNYLRVTSGLTGFIAYRLVFIFSRLGANMSRRSRRENVAKEEKEAFKALLRKHSPVPEIKKSDSVTNKAKSDCWQKIHVPMKVLFPANEPIKVPQLKKLWERMKMDVKQDLDAYSLKVSLFLKYTIQPGLSGNPAKR
ncbi:unnamed protein product [Darwinula stevensoni]|uniref:Regulatory protein zeste n=1 Tax=Darwinula stevensoni TaxID=69355 RepID=A0A7R8XFP9_9CRUS|nr:unnamed protein product [Darwinula stevensoni]CAG0895272.1 unnamed protein product [Darwinula stevensoni]